VGPIAGLDDVEKRKFLTLPGLELRPLHCPARSQSLYRLRYPSSKDNHIHVSDIKNIFVMSKVEKKAMMRSYGIMVTFTNLNYGWK
jgi:hypothetical protein